jgi:hypothetical protein
VLIIETEISVALLVKSVLREMGALAVGPAFNLRQSEHLAVCWEVDAALLSAHLNGEDPPFSVATILRERGIPFILLTKERLPAIENVPTLQRPFSRAEINLALQTHFGFHRHSWMPLNATSRSKTPSGWCAFKIKSTRDWMTFSKLLRWVSKMRQKSQLWDLAETGLLLEAWPSVRLFAE